MSSSGWSKVAAGARLVASAVAKQGAGEAGVAAQRATHHALELSLRARQTAFVAAQQEVWGSSPTTHESDKSHGTSPYESQLRKKHQKQQEQEVNGNSEAAPNLNGTKTANKAVAARSLNPYLLHQEHGEMDTVNNNYREQDSVSSYQSTPSPEQTLGGESNETIITTAKSAFPSIEDTNTPIHLKEGRAVPSSRLGRAVGFASLGVGLAWGSTTELASRWLGSGGSTSVGSPVASNDNADRLASTLCRMRGAALKMGQMLSIQDESLLPPALTRALQQVRQGADAMPHYQLEQQLVSQLGSNWRDKFETFDERPFAAASIGQVHRATIRDSNDTLHHVVVKVQYPGVASSIESDLRNLSMLVTMTGFSPKGLFIDNVIRVGRDELKIECNYLNEMANQEAMKALVESDPILRKNGFVVPNVIEEFTTEQVITSEYSPGGTIDKVSHLDAEERNRIGRTILYLTMKELFEWRLMQTDPNWGNFLYDVGKQHTTLIDFGATREFPKSFVDGYLRIVWASANQDEKTLMEQSHRMGFLTGEENEEMLRAHTLSGFTVGEPFWTNDEPFDFQGSNISTRMGEHTSVFLKHRLTPPPEEVYTLHRKLAGAYMLCIKLGAVIRCRDMLEDVVANHNFEDGLPHPMASKLDT